MVDGTLETPLPDPTPGESHSFAPAETFLGNGSSSTATPTVARNSYVHPDIVDLYLSGALSDV